MARRGLPRPRSRPWPRQWNVPQAQRTGFLPRLGRSSPYQEIIGGAFFINAVVTTYATGGTSSYLIRVPVLAGLLVINVLLYFASFTVLTPKVIGPRGLPFGKRSSARSGSPR